MKIKDKLYLSTFISIILVVIFVYLVVVTSIEINEKNDGLELALDIKTAVSELDVLTYEYLLHREARMEKQWNTKYNSGAIILREEAEAEAEAAAAFRDNYIELGRIFLQVTKNYKKSQSLIRAEVSQEKIDASLLLEERLVSQLLIESQSIISTSTRLSEKALEEIAEAQRLANILIIFLMIVLAGSVTLISLLIARSISQQLLV